MNAAKPPFAPKILVVDDEPDHARMTANLVAALWPAAEIRLAEDGDEAQAQALQFRPDLILSDLRMPGKDGHELCRWLRRSPDLSRTRIIVGTAFHHVIEQRRAYEAGADDYLTKPYSTRDLWRSCSRLLDPEGRWTAIHAY